MDTETAVSRRLSWRLWLSVENGETWIEEIWQIRISCNFFKWPLTLQSEIFISLKQRVKQRWDLSFALQDMISTIFSFEKYWWNHGLRNLEIESLSNVTMADSSIRWPNWSIFCFIFSICKTETLISASFVEWFEVTELIVHFFHLSVDTLNLYQL